MAEAMNAISRSPQEPANRAVPRCSRCSPLLRGVAAAGRGAPAAESARASPTPSRGPDSRRRAQQPVHLLLFSVFHVGNATTTLVGQLSAIAQRRKWLDIRCRGIRTRVRVLGTARISSSTSASATADAGTGAGKALDGRSTLCWAGGGGTTGLPAGDRIVVRTVRRGQLLLHEAHPSPSPASSRAPARRGSHLHVTLPGWTRCEDNATAAADHWARDGETWPSVNRGARTRMLMHRACWRRRARGHHCVPGRLNRGRCCRCSAT